MSATQTQTSLKTKKVKKKIEYRNKTKIKKFSSTTTTTTTPTTRSTGTSITSSTNTTSTTTPRRKCHHKKEHQFKKIRFDKVDIIELPIGLGDNPSVQGGGPPISCSWHPQLRLSADLDKFERMRAPLRRGYCRRICQKLRTALVEKHGGFSQVEIDMAIIDAKKAKLERFFSFMTSNRPSPKTTTATSYCRLSSWSGNDQSNSADMSC